MMRREDFIELIMLARLLDVEDGAEVLAHAKRFLSYADLGELERSIPRGTEMVTRLLRDGRAESEQEPAARGGPSPLAAHVHYHVYRATPKRPASWRRAYAEDRAGEPRFEPFQTPDDLVAAVREIATTAFLATEPQITRRVERVSADCLDLILEGSSRQAVLRCFDRCFTFEGWREALGALVSPVHAVHQ